ncbi:hypothetical protein I4U23_031472 [Adineta vaga]|nr:hypothetical protein I4U23_031472 [Adineta vaga]
MATPSIVIKLVKEFVNMFSNSQDVDVYLLFKRINKNEYVNSVRISHWQVVCHFKVSNQYKCYELRTNNGDKGGNIDYLISDFEFNDIIYYYYVGQCNMSEEQLQNNCKQIIVNNIKYILGVIDCQTWATLFIESLGLTVNGIGPLLTKMILDGPLSHTQSFVARIPDLLVETSPKLNYLLSRVKICRGHQNLEPKHKMLLT